jgi:hypothetical protein
MWKTHLWKTTAVFLISRFIIADTDSFDKYPPIAPFCIGSRMLKTPPSTHGVAAGAKTQNMALGMRKTK